MPNTARISGHRGPPMEHFRQTTDRNHQAHTLLP